MTTNWPYDGRFLPVTAVVTTPSAAATTGSWKSSARFQSTERELGLWSARVLPVQTSPHGNGIWYAVSGWAVGLLDVSADVCTTSPLYEPSISSLVPSSGSFGSFLPPLGPFGSLGSCAAGWLLPP